MIAGALPEELVTRFRTLSLERIGRVESVWNALVQGVDDEEAVRAMSRDLHTLTAITRGIVDDKRGIHERELFEVLFQPGFSTRSNVGDVSGRGVGLDAVKAGLAKVGSSVSIRSRIGAGTTITSKW